MARFPTNFAKVLPGESQTNAIKRSTRHQPGGNPVAKLKSIPHRCYLREVAFEWELTKETIDLPLGCLQGGEGGGQT